jgi:hypothetical protein
MTDGKLLEEMGTNAQKWTQEFLKATSSRDVTPNEFAHILGWFANALEAGRSAGWSAGWTSQAMGDPGISEIGRRSNATAHEKGWWEADRSFGEVIALIHSEASEALEEWRDNHHESERYYSVAKYRPEPQQLLDLRAGFDVVSWARVLDRRGDGGFVGATELPEDVATELVHAGFLKPEGVPAELADIVIRVGDAADEYGIDLGQEVLLKQAYNSTRPNKHGGKRA